MKLTEVLPRLRVMPNFSHPEFVPNKPVTQEDLGKLLEAAEAQYEKVGATQSKDRSTPTWIYEFQKTYWLTTYQLLQAAALVGPDELPDHELPNLDEMEPMEAMIAMEEFGSAVLSEAKDRVVTIRTEVTVDGWTPCGVPNCAGGMVLVTDSEGQTYPEECQRCRGKGVVVACPEGITTEFWVLSAIEWMLEDMAVPPEIEAMAERMVSSLKEWEADKWAAQMEARHDL